MKRTNVWRTLFLSVSTVAALSCDTSQVAGPIGREPAVASGPQSFPTAKVVACPTNDAFSTTAQVGPLGGVLDAGGTTVSIPAGALLNTVTVTLTVPSSNNVEIDVSVAGAEQYVFEQPIVVTVSYARCNRSDIDATPMSAWHFDPATGDLLELMPSVDNKLLRTVTFTTGHLSGYILAN